MKKRIALSGILSSSVLTVVALISLSPCIYWFGGSGLSVVFWEWGIPSWLCYNLWSLILLILAFGCLLNIKPLKIIGTVLGLLGSLVNSVEIVREIAPHFPVTYFIEPLLTGVFWIFLLIFFSTDNRKPLFAYIAVGMRIAAYISLLVFTIYADVMYYDHWRGVADFRVGIVVGDILEVLLLTAVPVIFAIDTDGSAGKRKLPKNSPVNLSTTLAQIMKLKDLLDNGIITAEEFEAKKKQILSL